MLQMGGIYDVSFWDGLWGHDIHTKFLGDRFRHLSNITVNTVTVWEADMLVLLIGGVNEVGRSEGLIWYDSIQSFMKIGTGIQEN
jgi:hypothetical protein